MGEIPLTKSKHITKQLNTSVISLIVLLFAFSTSFAQLQYSSYPRSLENTISVEKLRDVLFEMTSPAFEGRELGTPGNIKASDWLAYTFQQNNLKPVPSLGSFKQNFPIHRLEIDSVLLQFNEYDHILFEDFTISHLSSDFSGSVKHQNVTFLDYSKELNLYTNLKNITDSDTEAVFIVHTDPITETDIYRFEQRIDLPMQAKKSIGNSSQPFIDVRRLDIPVLHITESVAEQFHQEPESSISMHIELNELQPRTASNLIGYSGADYDDEYNTSYVLITSYFDHEGLHPNSGIPYFGAIDNASGIAMMLESQRMLERVAHRFEHPVIWVVFNGNNRYKAGLQHFIENNTLYQDRCIIHIDFSSLASSPRTETSSLSIDNRYVSQQVNYVIDELSNTYDTEIKFTENGAPFFDDKPYLFFGGDEFPYSNRIMDSSDKVNMSHLYDNTLFMTELIWIFTNLLDTNTD